MKRLLFLPLALAAGLGVASASAASPPPIPPQNSSALSPRIHQSDHIQPTETPAASQPPVQAPQQPVQAPPTPHQPPTADPTPQIAAIGVDNLNRNYPEYCTIEVALFNGPADIAPVVDFGDGTTGTAFVAPTIPGYAYQYAVTTGCHAYASAGSYTLTVTLGSVTVTSKLVLK